LRATRGCSSPDKAVLRGACGSPIGPAPDSEGELSAEGRYLGSLSGDTYRAGLSLRTHARGVEYYLTAAYVARTRAGPRVLLIRGARVRVRQAAIRRGRVQELLAQADLAR